MLLFCLTKTSLAKIEISPADKVVKIDGLKISYDSEKIVAIGHIRVNKPLLNQEYRDLTYFERKEYLQRQKLFPVLFLSIMFFGFTLIIENLQERRSCRVSPALFYN